MIRDPSDGSVKESQPVKSADGGTMHHDRGFAGLPEHRQLSSVSGLQTGTSRPGEIDRLNKSREWLKAYHQPKGV